MAAPLGSRTVFLWKNVSPRFRVCSLCARYLSTSGQKSNDAAQERKTHFGFQTVREEEKEHKVYEVFENVASRYDLMNDVMSGGIHRLWKDHFIGRLAPLPGTKLIDVAGGTGDIAFRFLQYAQSTPKHQIPSIMEENFDIKIPKSIEANLFTDREADESLSSSSSEDENGKTTKGAKEMTHVTVCDINQAMLDVGKKKAEDVGITSGMSWVQGNAEHLPFDDAMFDAYTIAFGIRNCTNVQQVINEAFRVLKPGGRFLCLEFSQVTNPLLRSIYDTYSFNVIPVMGQVIARDWKSYQYLVESIRQFPDQEEFADMIRLAGFRMVTYENLTFGVAAIHSGFKIGK